jgi:hypothetical protein
MAKHHSGQLKIINACLFIAAAACLAPQYWPGLGTVAGYLVVACGAVAAIAYFVRPTPQAENITANAQSENRSVDQDEMQVTAGEVVVLNDPDEVAADAIARITDVKLAKGYPTTWVIIDPEMAPTHQVPSLLWRRGKAMRIGSEPAGYVFSGGKIRRKLPRSQAGVIEPVVIHSPRSRAIH